jgi:hypothetical protein
VCTRKFEVAGQIAAATNFLIPRSSIPKIGTKLEEAGENWLLRRLFLLLGQKKSNFSLFELWNRTICRQSDRLSSQ